MPRYLAQAGPYPELGRSPGAPAAPLAPASVSPEAPASAPSLGLSAPPPGETDNVPPAPPEPAELDPAEPVGEPPDPGPVGPPPISPSSGGPSIERDPGKSGVGFRSQLGAATRIANAATSQRFCIESVLGEQVSGQTLYILAQGVAHGANCKISLFAGDVHGRAVLAPVPCRASAAVARLRPPEAHE